jgi:hypothetical protein
MKLPPILEGESRVRLLQGIAIGAIGAMVIGFGFSGWELHSNAERRADLRINEALVTALTPVCVKRFQSADNVEATTVALNEVESWRRDAFVEKGGWATFSGKTNNGGADACALALRAAAKK